MPSSVTGWMTWTRTSLLASLYDGGQVLKYDGTHVEHEYGGLGDQALDFRAFSAYVISASDFDSAWVENAALNR